MAASEAVTPWARQRSHSGVRWTTSMVFILVSPWKGGAHQDPDGADAPRVGWVID